MSISFLIFLLLFLVNVQSKCNYVRAYVYYKREKITDFNCAIGVCQTVKVAPGIVGSFKFVPSRRRRWGFKGLFYKDENCTTYQKASRRYSVRFGSDNKFYIRQYLRRMHYNGHKCGLFTQEVQDTCDHSDNLYRFKNTMPFDTCMLYGKHDLFFLQKKFYTSGIKLKLGMSFKLRCCKGSNNVAIQFFTNRLCYFHAESYEIDQMVAKKNTCYKTDPIEEIAEEFNSTYVMTNIDWKCTQSQIDCSKFTMIAENGKVEPLKEEILHKFQEHEFNINDSEFMHNERHQKFMRLAIPIGVFGLICCTVCITLFFVQNFRNKKLKTLQSEVERNIGQNVNAIDAQQQIILEQQILQNIIKNQEQKNDIDNDNHKVNNNDNEGNNTQANPNFNQVPLNANVDNDHVNVSAVVYDNKSDAKQAFLQNPNHVNAL